MEKKKKIIILIIFFMFFSFKNFVYSNELGVKIFNALKNQIGSKFTDSFYNPKAEKIYVPFKKGNSSIIIYKLSLTVKNSPDKKIQLFIPVISLNNKLFFTPSIIDLNTGKDLTVLWNFKLRKPVNIPYLNEALIFKPDGNNCIKIAVFSDPECPFCRKFIPELINFVKKNNKFCLYLYDYPLSFHKHAEQWSKFLIALLNNVKLNQKINVLYDFYSIKDLNNFNNEILNIAKKYKISQEKLLKEVVLDKKTDEILEKFKKTGKDLKINETPSLFIDGKKVRINKFFDIVSILK